jgi:hypothetical protein
LEEKQAEVDAYLASFATPESTSSSQDETRGPEWRRQEREYLLQEAGFLARSLYRNCLRSIRILRPGNEHDERAFRQQEEEQLEQERGSRFTFSMAPPVNRENELHSRAEYYRTHLRENYNSDSQCLDKNPWKEHDIEIFLHYVKTGEQRRTYVLRDYKFPDPFASHFDKERVKKFEQRAEELIKDTYKANGWRLPSDMYHREEDDDDDDSMDDPLDFSPKL